jgi:U4/U6.U5 tri-snRNP component SNU23
MSGAGGSGGGGPKGAVNVLRRTWDKEAFEVRAKERAEREAAGGRYEEEEAKPAAARSVVAGEPFRPALAGAAGPAGSERAFLSARTIDLELDGNLNKRRLVTDATPSGSHGGYWCEACGCSLKDSTAFLDHINGKRHQSKLGFSMRVEKSSVDAVRERLATVKSKLDAERAAAEGEGARREALAEYSSRVAAAEEEERARKRARRDKAPVAPAAAAGDGASREAAASEWEPQDTAMKAMMGFGGFS